MQGSCLVSTSGPTSARRRGSSGRPPPKESAVGRWIGVLAVIGLVAFFIIRAPTDPPPAGEGGAGGEGPALEPPPPPRCKAAEGTFRVGEGAKDDGDGGAGGEEPERFAPFSVEIGRGARVSEGWAVGIKRELKTEEGAGTFAEVVVLDDGATKGRVVRLGRTRGDLDAPLVVASDGGWVAAMLEPNASGLSTRLVRSKGDGLHWGAEIEQGRDESLALDVAIGERVGVVTWDDVTDDGERAVVMLATVATESLEGGERAVAVSGEGVDAELPRLTKRPGGFWLAYVARGRGDEDDEPRDPRATEGRFRAERIVPSWIELLPLDQDGKVEGEPRAVTPRTGHVLAFDMGPGKDGGVVIAWRDDDTPSGAQGGTVTVMLVGAAGVGQEQPVASDEVGAGVPNLVGGFLALPDGLGHVLAAPIKEDAELEGELRREDALGIGQVLAADGDRLLIARPSGKAADFAAVTCSRAP